MASSLDLILCARFLAVCWALLLVGGISKPALLPFVKIYA